MYKQSCAIICVCIAFTLAMFGCADDPASSSKYSLESAVELSGDTVDVTLSGTRGTIVFDLSEMPLSVEQENAFYTYLANETITLEVQNEESSVSYLISQGELVDEMPSEEGQYFISAASDLVQIVFWNDFHGSEIRVAGEYIASVDVSANEYFMEENFVADISVE